MLLVTTALSGLMAGVIQTAPTPPQTPPQQPQTPATTPAPATPAEDDDAYDLGTVSVVGQRPRGSVDTDIPADVTLTAEQIQAYGASNIAELMTYLEPLTRSSSGRTDLQPVFLVNGRRISGFQEIQGIPTEAIERTEILPEQVALQFGYRAEQRVVNFVLKANFNSITGELTGRAPTQGGRSTVEVEGNVLRISGSNRWSMDLEYEHSSPLFESERDINRSAGSTPYDLIGNVTSNPYSEGCLTATPATCTVIDPTLGTAVTPVPGTTTSPTLADFVAAASGGVRTGDLGAYRTLLSESDRATVRGTMKRDLNGTTQLTVSGSLDDNSSRSFNGLPGVSLALSDSNPWSPFADDVLVHRYIDDAASLRRETDSLNGKLGVVVDGFLGDDWRWTATGNYERTETDTTTGRGYEPLVSAFQTRLNADDATANPFAALNPADFTRIPNDTANSVSQLLSAEVVLNGDVYDLPAGGVTSTFKLGADTRSLDSTSTRGGLITDRSQSRDRFNGQGTFNLPIASRRQEVLPMLGDLSVNLTLGYEELSDFGGLSSYNIGVNWSPIEKLSFLVSYADEQGAPSISQLNDPAIATPNVPVFDFATGQTVLVTQTTGGNPNLQSDNRHVFRLGGTFRPFTERDLTLQSTWTVSRTDDYLAGFPTITPDLEAALPGRFTRSTIIEPGQTVGTLLAIDSRPLNFKSYERQDIRTGLNYSRAFGTPTPTAAGQTLLPGMPGGPRPPGGGGMQIRVEGGPPPGGGGGGPRMGGGGRGMAMQPGQGRFNISLYHTVRLQDEITIADGLPVIDLLDGGATSANGGSPRNELQLVTGVFRNGFGGFMFATWREGTRVDGGTGPDLTFADRTTVNLNLFMDLNQRTGLIAKYPILKGTRIQFGVQNLFDSRPEVSTSSGDLPLNYQSDYLDPQGRVVSLTLRKILF